MINAYNVLKNIVSILCIYFSNRYVVRNSNINGSWGEEETASPIKFNINDFKKFQIKILTTLDSFMVTVNEHHICSYKFRIPVEYIERLQVTGQLFLKSVQFKKVDFYPFPLKTLDKVSKILFTREHQVFLQFKKKSK